MTKMKLNGKLSLNKEIVAKLNDSEMEGVKGGLLSITRHCSHIHNTCGCNWKATKPLFCNPDEVPN